MKTKIFIITLFFCCLYLEDDKTASSQINPQINWKEIVEDYESRTSLPLSKYIQQAKNTTDKNDSLARIAREKYQNMSLKESIKDLLVPNEPNEGYKWYLSFLYLSAILGYISVILFMRENNA